MLTHHQKRWDIALKKQNQNHIHSYTPLWFNGCLPELCTVPDPQLWAAYGIISLSKILTEAGPKNFRHSRKNLHFRITYCFDTCSLGMRSKHKLILPMLVTPHWSLMLYLGQNRLSLYPTCTIFLDSTVHIGFLRQIN